MARVSFVQHPPAPAKLAALPEPFQRQLLRFHENSKQNGGGRAWTTEEDADILMQLKLGAHVVSQRKVVGERPLKRCHSPTLDPLPEGECVRGCTSFGDERECVA